MTGPDPAVLRAAATIAGRLAEPPTDLSGPARRPAPHSLASGAAGTALLHIERARSGHGCWAEARAWLTAAAQGELSAGPDACLFYGAPALAFVTRCAADRPGLLTRAVADLHAATVAVTHRRLAAAHARIDVGGRPALAEFDLIRGLTGLGAYHLGWDSAHETTRAVLSYLVRLTEPLPGSDERPGWWSGVAPTGRPSPEFPEGHGNLGMAHGISGPLALLSLATIHGVVVDGQASAIARVCRWLDNWLQEHPSGSWWPRVVTGAPGDRSRHAPRRPGPPSWCYGTPGVARAQQLAALATGDHARRQLAESAMHGCLHDPDQLGQLAHHGLCHGYAGVVQVAWRMASDARDPELRHGMSRAAARVAQALGTALPGTEGPRTGRSRTGGPRTGRSGAAADVSAAGTPGSDTGSGLLDGIAGTALALHTAGTGSAPVTGWDRLLLLG